MYIDSIEFVMSALDLQKVILIGHSFGGYLSAAFALKKPERIQHLILVDAWGFVENNEEYIRPLLRLLLRLPSPLGLLRHSGYAGPYFLRKFRPDFANTFALEESNQGYLPDETDEGDETSTLKTKAIKRSNTTPSSLSEEVVEKWTSDIVYDYIYHCNMRNPTGEAAFYGLCKRNFFALHPMTPRLKDADDKLPMTFIYGGRSWIDSSSGFSIKGYRPNSFVDIKIIETGGHQAFAQCSNEFNEIVCMVSSKINEKSGQVIQDSKSRFGLPKDED